VIVGNDATVGTGAVVLFTVMVNDCVALPQLFCAFTVTVVTPTLKVAPLPVPVPCAVVAPLKV
jgi:hypothetical protein